MLGDRGKIRKEYLQDFKGDKTSVADPVFLDHPDPDP